MDDMFLYVPRLEEHFDFAYNETQPMFHTIFEDSLVMVLVNEMINIFLYLSILGIYHTLVLLVYSQHKSNCLFNWLFLYTT